MEWPTEDAVLRASKAIAALSVLHFFGVMALAWLHPFNQSHDLESLIFVLGAPPGWYFATEQVFRSSPLLGWLLASIPWAAMTYALVQLVRWLVQKREG